MTSSITPDFVVVVRALVLNSRVAGHVGIICFCHDTLILHEIPRVAHPAAVATPTSVVLAEQIHIEIIVAKGAIG